MWEVAAGKELFRYEETSGALTINLIYDSRQETTNKLQRIDGTIATKQSSYDTLKASYDTLQEKFADQKSRYASSSDSLDRTRRLYEREIGQWNRRGGAPEPDYSRLQQEKNAINARITSLNTQLNALNNSTDELNALAEKINVLAKDLHLDVDLFNTTRRTNGDEFSEGEYERDSRGERINIYEFGSDVKLIRVLTHELGHALQIDHVDDEEAIMYRLNSGKTETLAVADISELKKVCRIK
jgi:chromosome segregation ATPase